MPRSSHPSEVRFRFRRRYHIGPGCLGNTKREIVFDTEIHGKSASFEVLGECMVVRLQDLWIEMNQMYLVHILKV